MVEVTAIGLDPSAVNRAEVYDAANRVITSANVSTTPGLETSGRQTMEWVAPAR